MININNKITFIEGNVTYVNNNIDEITFNEKQLIDNKLNYFNELFRTINVNIFIGNFSKYLDNQLLNSVYYKKDKKYNEKNNLAFDESKTNNKDLPVNTFYNPLIFRKTLGVDATYYFDDFYITPFNDVDNIENDISIYFKNKNEINYPYYYNALNSIDKNAEICVLGTVDELNGNYLTEKLLSKGIKAEIIGKGIDSRNRSNITSNIILNETNLSEPFSDEEIENLVTGNDILLKRKINYTTKEINGIIYNIVDYQNESTQFMPKLTNKMVYYSKDNNLIIPFNDNFDDDIIKQKQTTMSTGSDTDKSKSSNFDSTTFLKDLD